MQIDRIIFPVETLGPGKRMAIWTIGCPHRCKNCSNPELWEENPKKEIPIGDIIKIINKQDGIDGITITGGDPFCQRSELMNLVNGIRNKGIDDILVYTGYLYEKLQQDEVSRDIIGNISALVDGPYIDELNDNIGLRGSSNQRIFVFDKKYEETYKNFEHNNRRQQNFVNNGSVISVGIPSGK